MDKAKAKAVIKWDQPDGKGYGHISCESGLQGARLVFYAEKKGDIDLHLFPTEMRELRDQLSKAEPFSMTLGRSVDLDETRFDLEIHDDVLILTVEEVIDCGAGCRLAVTPEILRALAAALTD